MVKKTYPLEPKETTPIQLTMPMKVVIYVGIAGVILLGVWPQPFIEFSVAATSVFTGLAAR